jgi:hypothetical protein
MYIVFMWAILFGIAEMGGTNEVVRPLRLD